MRHWRWGVALAALLSASCVPWTVRPIDEERAGAFDPERYVESIWNAKVLPAAAQGVELTALHSTPAAAMVRGHGQILRIDTASRTGMMFLDSGVAIQIGPVIRGTALRDALPFIQFSQFTNQLEFARVANALNARAAKLPAGAAPGDVVDFAGAMSPGSPPEIVPVTLTLKGKA